jgi:hypothetical protein
MRKPLNDTATFFVKIGLKTKEMIMIWGRKKRLLFMLFVLALLASVGAQQSPPTQAPKTWDDEAIATLDVPIADKNTVLKHTTAQTYYSIALRGIWRNYPIYAPGKEPPGYIAWLEEQEPDRPFDASSLKTMEDWIAAGESIFDAPITYNDVVTAAADLREPEWFKKFNVPIAKDGTMPFLRYVIRKKGRLEVGSFSCAMCHSRVMPDGSVVKGAQGNFPFDRLFANLIRAQIKPEEHHKPNNTLIDFERVLFAAPWLRPDPHLKMSEMSVDEIAKAHEAIPPGVMTRFGTSLFSPPQVPDLIGLKDRRYLDHTGLMRHRGVEDLMRYSAINQGIDLLDQFNEFTPKGKLPPPGELARYSDEQLYALGLYIYSLKSPPNPNKFNNLAAKGQEVFTRAGCAVCHTPPLYTNNMLTPVDGFDVPEEHLRKFDVMKISVGTDPFLALQTRRGTGYYKVPSLKGLWYRGPFEHNGSVATLEDWFDSRRLRNDYEPTGYRGHVNRPRPVKGHVYGLDLSANDRKALIAFLKTL